MAKAVKNISETIVIGPDCRERFLPLHLPEAATLRRRGLRLGGVSALRRPYEIGRAPASTHVLLCTTAGRARWWTSRDEGAIAPRSLWWFPAGGAYGYAIGSATWRMHWLHLAAEVDWGIEADAPTELGEPSAGLCQAMEGLIREEHSACADSHALRGWYAELIWAWLGRTLRRRRPVRDAMAERLSMLWQEVSANLARPWTVGALARRVHVSGAHLHRLTLSGQGRTPMQCVTDLRMRRARSLLAGTNASLTDIAAAVGYQTPFAFSRAFKRCTGLSPRAFRAAGSSD